MLDMIYVYLMKVMNLSLRFLVHATNFGPPVYVFGEHENRKF
jgi:hypothetical protein